MEFLSSWLESSSLPLLTAFILGLMTAISPCPLATNITAVGYISKDIERRQRIFLNGIIYTLGRAIAYTGLAAVLYYSADKLSLTDFFQRYGEKVIGPVLLVMGIIMLGLFSIRIPLFSKGQQKMERRGVRNYWDVLVLGIVFALAFCPYSGVLYFGMLIPLTISNGVLLAVVFALATGIPVIIVSWLIAFTVRGVGNFYNSIRRFESWFRKVVAVLFILTGIYYILIIYAGLTIPWLTP